MSGHHLVPEFWLKKLFSLTQSNELAFHLRSVVLPSYDSSPFNQHTIFERFRLRSISWNSIPFVVDNFWLGRFEFAWTPACLDQSPSLIISTTSILGVENVWVALMAAKAEVEFDASKVLPNQIANSINDLGFPSTVIDGETGAGEIELEVRMLLYGCSSVDLYLSIDAESHLLLLLNMVQEAKTALVKPACCELSPFPKFLVSSKREGGYK